MYPIRAHEVPPVDSGLEVDVPRLPEAVYNRNLGPHPSHPRLHKVLVHLGRAREHVARHEAVVEENVTEDLVRVPRGDRGEREVPRQAVLGIRDEVVTLVEELGGHVRYAAEADLTRGRRHRPHGEVVVEVPAEAAREKPPIARADNSKWPTRWLIWCGRDRSG